MSEIDPGDTAKILSEHYTNTNTLTHEQKKQRNQFLLILLAVIGVATLLTFEGPATAPLIVEFIANTLGISDPTRIDTLQNSFPFGLLQSILLFVIFFLMVNLYNRAANVIRLYSYLGKMEEEIRSLLDLGEDTISFTREGLFYWKTRPPLFSSVKWAYIFLMGLLLIAFLGGRIIEDFTTGNYFWGAADTVISIFILIYFIAYAGVSISMDKREANKKKEEQSD
jgi:hypothetical protein